MRTPVALATTLALLLAACSPGGDAASDSAAGDAAATADAADPDRAVTGSGVPAGYTARTDNPNADMTTLAYATSGNDWEITTGPAHIVYAAGDTASGQYTVRTTFEQLEAPRHPEAYGIFIGGENLDQPSQRYTYFLVRGTGEYLVKVREGSETRNVAAWTKSDAVPAQDSSGRATYPLAIQVGADSVRFRVGDQTVATVAKSAIPTDGVVGLRVNHNLHVKTQPVVVER